MTESAWLGVGNDNDQTSDRRCFDHFCGVAENPDITHRDDVSEKTKGDP